jgi:hypothetical protein
MLACALNRSGTAVIISPTASAKRNVTGAVAEDDLE